MITKTKTETETTTMTPTGHIIETKCEKREETDTEIITTTKVSTKTVVLKGAVVNAG
jgi:hypothetical protein